MKNMKKFMAACLSLLMCLSLIPMSTFAAEVPDATIDEDANCSLTIWKYDWTNGATRS